MRMSEKNPITLVYLARRAEGIPPVEAFAQSYRNLPAGIDHNLAVICKGADRAYTEAVKNAFGNDATYLTRSDEGVDIHAYLDAARQIETPRVCFLNTFSVIAAPGWLGKLNAIYQQPGIGLVGASGTYESLLDSLKFHMRVVWAVNNKGIRYDCEFADRFRSILAIHAPAWLAQRRSLISTFRALLRPRPSFRDLSQEEFFQFWSDSIKPGGPLNCYAMFPRFPNPHIRTNAFMMERTRFVQSAEALPPTKISGLEFESGFTSLTNQILAMGLKAVVVGADGRGYEEQDWGSNGGFRQGRQGNLLVSDNQTRSFQGLNDRDKENLVWLTWGSDFAASPAIKHFANTTEIKATEILAKRRDKAPAASVSIVIPTHNRLALVKGAIDTVIRQDAGDWELIVYDNCSEEPVSPYVRALNHPNVKVVRSETFLNVTSSWNAAFNLAQGDYVMLIGDDDGLMPDFFTKLRRIIDDYEAPDFIYSPILQFFHPGVAPWQPQGYVALVRQGMFFRGKTAPFYLAAPDKRAAVEGSLRIRRNFIYNMQGMVFRRAAAEALKVDGNFFQSPFPDYYIANVAILLCDKVLVNPEPLAIAGVSKASFGFTLFNNEEERGSALLKTQHEDDQFWPEMKAVILPGPTYLTNFIITMRHVYERIRGSLSVEPDYQRYRLMQLFALADGNIGKKQIGQMNLTLSEKAFYGIASCLAKWRDRSRLTRALVSRLGASLSQTSFPATVVQLNVGDFTSTGQLYEALQNSSLVYGPTGSICAHTRATSPGDLCQPI